MNADYTPAELMVVAAAREIRDGDVVFVGMRLPLLAFQLAQATHAPRAVGVFEAGIVRAEPAPAPLVTMGDLPNLHGALWCTDSLNALGLLQRGLIDVGFIGGAQVDRYGNLNTTYVMDHAELEVGKPGTPAREQALREALRPGASSLTRLPGSGGACDIASLAGRLVLIMAHERRRFVERVDYVTSPGHGTGRGWRGRAGLPGGGPAAVITTLAVLRFDEAGEMYLASVHPGRTVAEVQAHTGWDLALAEDVSQTPPPTPEELSLVRRWDPEGFWTR